MFAVVPAANVQLAAELNVPVEFVVKVTAPVGVDAPLEDVSVTVAVQVVGVPTWTDPGEHVTVVEVGWGGTVTFIDAVP